MGNIRTAIFNYLFTKHYGGQFILRIEDTDKERSKPEYEVEIVENLHWLGLEWDNPVILKQSERSEIYNSYLKKLVDAGHAYISKESPKEAGQRSEVIRFKNPNKKIKFEDLIRGEIEFDTTDLGDFVIAKSLTEPIYHLAAVIDDFESGVTHIIRGEDHISNTPRQILIQEAIAAPRPVYAHLPLILDTDRAKLSKRKHGEKISLKYFIDNGYLPQGVINYMAMLGWNPGTDQEIFTLDELVKIFDITKVQKSGAIFDEGKLRWVNKQHILKLPPEQLYARVKECLGDLNLPGEKLKVLTPILIERADTFGDIKTMAASGELEYFFSQPTYEGKSLYWKGKEDSDVLIKRLKHVKSELDKMNELAFNRETVKTALWDYATTEGRGEVLWPIRFALSGKDKSPDPFVLAEFLGKSETMKRLEVAIKKIS